MGSLQEVFHKQDSSRSGYLKWAQLQAAMREAGRHKRELALQDRNGQGEEAVRDILE